MRYDKLRFELIKKGVVLRNNVNKMCFHSRNESQIHFLIKSMISHIIFTKGDGLVTEAEFENGRVVDVLQMKDSGNLIGYEIESEKNNKQDVDKVDIIEINVKDIPVEIKNNCTKLYTWLKNLVV